MSDHTQETVFKTLTLKQTQITLRLAREEDLPKLEWQGEYIHFRNIFQYTFREQKIGRRLMLLADFNGYPIGQVFLLLNQPSYYTSKPKNGYLYSLRVMAPFQGMGLGTQLMHQAEEIMREKGLHTASIAVANDNHGALRLYKRLGYQIYGYDEGKWSYTNHLGKVVFVHEPCSMLEKVLS